MQSFQPNPKFPSLFNSLSHDLHSTEFIHLDMHAFALLCAQPSFLIHACFLLVLIFMFTDDKVQMKKFKLWALKFSFSSLYLFKVVCRKFNFVKLSVGFSFSLWWSIFHRTQSRKCFFMPRSPFFAFSFLGGINGEGEKEAKMDEKSSKESLKASTRKCTVIT